MDINKTDVKSKVERLAKNHLTKASDEYKTKIATVSEHFVISTKKTWNMMSLEETFTSDDDDYMYAEFLLDFNESE